MVAKYERVYDRLIGSDAIETESISQAAAAR
jgi:hypothetical protein